MQAHYMICVLYSRAKLKPFLSSDFSSFRVKGTQCIFTFPCHTLHVDVPSYLIKPDNTGSSHPASHSSCFPFLHPDTRLFPKLLAVLVLITQCLLSGRPALHCRARGNHGYSCHIQRKEGRRRKVEVIESMAEARSSAEARG